MLLVDAKQPTQPTVVTRDTFEDQAIASFGSLNATSIRSIRSSLGAAVLVCEPFCSGAIDEAILDAFIVGAAVANVSAGDAIDDNGWRIHDGPIEPFKKRSSGLKYGGAALAVAGGVLTALWSHVPVVNRVAVSPSVGGIRMSASLSF